MRMPPCILHSLNLPNFGSLGPSGAGKTTLLEILATILLPTRGEVRVCGYDVVRQAVPVRKIVGYCPSTTESFYPGLTGWENPEFFGLLNGLPLGKAKQKIAWAMNLVGMDGTRAVPFQRLSQGMKQRLALAHALEGTRALVLGGVFPAEKLQLLAVFSLASLPASLLAFVKGVQWTRVSGTLSHF